MLVVRVEMENAAHEDGSEKAFHRLMRQSSIYVYHNNIRKTSNGRRRSKLERRTTSKKERSNIKHYFFNVIFNFGLDQNVYY